VTDLDPRAIAALLALHFPKALRQSLYEELAELGVVKDQFLGAIAQWEIETQVFNEGSEKLRVPGAMPPPAPPLPPPPPKQPKPGHAMHLATHTAYARRYKGVECSCGWTHHVNGQSRRYLEAQWREHMRSVERAIVAPPPPPPPPLPRIR